MLQKNEYSQVQENNAETEITIKNEPKKTDITVNLIDKNKIDTKSKKIEKTTTVNKENDKKSSVFQNTQINKDKIKTEIKSNLTKRKTFAAISDVKSTKPSTPTKYKSNNFDPKNKSGNFDKTNQFMVNSNRKSQFQTRRLTTVISNKNELNKLDESKDTFRKKDLVSLDKTMISNNNSTKTNTETSNYKGAYFNEIENLTKVCNDKTKEFHDKKKSLLLELNIKKNDANAFDNKIAKLYNSRIKDGERKINIKDRYYLENIK